MPKSLMVSVFGLMLAAAPLVANAADPALARVWKSKCAACHGADGKGETEQGKKLKIADLAKSKSDDAKLKDAITNGAKKEGKEVMEGYKEKLKPEQIDGLVAFCRELRK